MNRLILVIEDEESLRQLVQTVLEIKGNWRVITAVTAKEGFHKAIAQQPDAILLNVKLPDMDGVVLLRNLLQDPKTASIPVILITGKILTTEESEFALENGAAGAIAKPFDVFELVGKVAKILGDDCEG